MAFVLIKQPRPHVTQITLNRPERMNAMSFDILAPLLEALENVNYNNDCRVVILTGAGRGFCSGADLVDQGFLPIFEGLGDSGVSRRAMRVANEVILAMRSMNQPVIGAINGPAVGGGFCLSMACDIRIAAESAFFRAAGINNGLSAAELGLSFILPRTVGIARAFDIMLSGRDIDATEAERIGMVSRIVPQDDLLNTCYELAERIVSFSQLGVEFTKQMLWDSLDAGSFLSHVNHEAHAQLFMRQTTSNFEEAVKARKQKRKPAFQD